MTLIPLQSSIYEFECNVSEFFLELNCEGDVALQNSWIGALGASISILERDCVTIQALVYSP